MILRTAQAALAVVAITTSTAQAQTFGNGGFRGANDGAVQRTVRGLMMQRFFDSATIYGVAQHRGNSIFPSEILRSVHQRTR